MNGLKNEKNVNVLERARGLDIVIKALRKRSVAKLGVVSALALIGAMSCEAVQAQQIMNAKTAPTVVVSPWTTQDGREAINLGNDNARPSTAKKANYIRQISTLAQDDEYIDAIPSDGALETLGSYETPEKAGSWSSSEFDASSLGDVEDIPQNVVAPLTAIPSPQNYNTDARKSAPVVSTEVTNYPQGDVHGGGFSSGKNGQRQGDNSSAVSSAPSTNPYARIGQAEYNPNQFYGGGGNYSVNGYRNMPPAVAYGQSACGDCYDGQYASCGVLGNILRDIQLEAGVVSMRSPMDFEDNGNAGAEFAINWGSAQPVLFGLNVQAGARGVFTDYNGVQANGFTTDGSRNQVFWTTGVYFRSPVYSDGWSGGVVYDSLIENYYRKYELSQLRAELSYNFTNFCEIGVRGAFALNDDWCDFLDVGNDLKVEAKATASSYYTMFLRKRFIEGAEATLFGGVTEWSEGLVGASAEAPLSDAFALRASTTYVFPTERGLNDKSKEESWNISVGLAWYLGGSARNGIDSQRPLFEVADNGSFLQNFLR